MSYWKEWCHLYAILQPKINFFCSSVPRIPWAFAMTEVCGMILCYIWILVLLLHKHRYFTSLKHWKCCLSCVKVTKPVSPFAVSFSSHCDIIVIGIGECFDFDQQKSPPEAIPTLFSNILSVFYRERTEIVMFRHGPTIDNLAVIFLWKLKKCDFLKKDRNSSKDFEWKKWFSVWRRPTKKEIILHVPGVPRQCGLL